MSGEPALCCSGLVGANGAGKTTLLHLAIGLLRPTGGSVRMFGEPLRLDRPAGLAAVGFVAQDHPLYRRFTVADLLHFGRSMNRRFDLAGARDRLRGLGSAWNTARGGCPAGSRRRSRSPSHWPSNRDCSCSTSRSRPWIRSPAGSSSGPLWTPSPAAT